MIWNVLQRSLFLKNQLYRSVVLPRAQTLMFVDFSCMDLLVLRAHIRETEHESIYLLNSFQIHLILYFIVMKIYS